MADEYIRKQDAVSIIEKEMKNYVSDIWYKSATHSALNDVNENIKAFESADVVQVVRCKNCENWQTDWNPSISNRHYCAVMDSMMTAEDFCSYGEREG